MPMFKRSLLVFIMLLTAAFGAAIYGYYESQEAVPLAAGEKEFRPETQEKITVYVTGAVTKPGLISLDSGVRVADAVNACGGLLPTADGAGVNMAKILTDGEHIKVPEKTVLPTTDRPPAGQISSARTDTNGKVNINTADAAALTALPGIGPVMAKRIVEYRETEGAFQSPEDLKKVRGIGEAKFAKIKDMVTL